MVWLTNPVPDFDAEKRRRWYAFFLSAISSASLVIAFLIREGVGLPNQPIWEIGLAIFAIWFFFFILKYAAAYAIWYTPYASRLRAISFSLLAVLAVYSCLMWAVVLVMYLKEPSFQFADAVKGFWRFHVTIYGLPYLAGAIVGWLFARPAPDVREQF